MQTSVIKRTTLQCCLHQIDINNWNSIIKYVVNQTQTITGTNLLTFKYFFVKVQAIGHTTQKSFLCRNVTVMATIFPLPIFFLSEPFSPKYQTLNEMVDKKINYARWLQQGSYIIFHKCLSKWKKKWLKMLNTKHTARQVKGANQQCKTPNFFKLFCTTG